MSSLKSELGRGRKGKKTKNPPWSQKEHNALSQSLQKHRKFELTNRVKFPLRDMKLWAEMSDKLVTKYNINRTPNSCKLYWNRYGRVESGFDERTEQKPDRLATSIQHTMSNKKLFQTTTKNNNLRTSSDSSKVSETSGTIDFMTSPVSCVAKASDVPDTKDCFMAGSPILEMRRSQRIRKPNPGLGSKTSFGASMKRVESTTMARKSARVTRATKKSDTGKIMLKFKVPKPAVPTAQEVRSRAARVKWTTEQLSILEEVSVQAKGHIPTEERYSRLSQRLGWRVKYQDIKDWFFVNASKLATRNRPADYPYERDPEYDPYFPVDESTVLPSLERGIGIDIALKVLKHSSPQGTSNLSTCMQRPHDLSLRSVTQTGPKIEIRSSRRPQSTLQTMLKSTIKSEQFALSNLEQSVLEAMEEDSLARNSLLQKITQRINEKKHKIDEYQAALDAMEQ